MIINKVIMAAFLLLLTAAAPAHVKADLVGVQFNGTIVRINERNAMSVVIGESGVGPLFSFARNDSGTYFATSNSNLYTINPDTGAGTLITPINSTGVPSFVTGLAFSPAGTLYAIGSIRGVFDNNSLFTLDPVNGALTLIGETGVGGLQDLAISPDGTLYGYSFGGGSEDERIGFGLVTIDPLTGRATDVNLTDNSIVTLTPFALTFSPSGALYGTNIGIPDALLRIDTTSGEVRIVGVTGTNQVQGIAFIGEERPIPEPTTMLLLGTGLVGLGAAARRRRKGNGA